MSIHIHVWSANSEEILEEHEAAKTEDYGDYIQYGFRLYDGRWIELRVPKS